MQFSSLCCNLESGMWWSRIYWIKALHLIWTLSLLNSYLFMCNIEETEKKQKAEQLALFAKSPSSSGMSGSLSRKKKSKKVKSKSKPRPADTSCHTCSEKGH